MVEVITFQQVLDKAKLEKGHLRLLLGNGFSISLFPNIFSYSSLFEQALSKQLFEKVSKAIPDLFKVLDTFDFEHIMQLLAHATVVLPHYKDDPSVIKSINDDIEKLKQILVEAITSNHPNSPNEITESQYVACKKFLSHFESVYTVNYDLLLYWVVLKYLDELGFTDGFHDPMTGVDPSDYYEKDYVSRSPGESSSFKLHHLHGALHLYDAKYENRKYCWARTGVKLKDQILSALNNGLFPLFISEGDSKSKLTKINHNTYLASSFKSIGNIGGALVVYGMGFKENDEHIMNAIVNSDITHIYLSVYGDIASTGNKHLIANVEKMKLKRDELNKNKKKNSSKKLLNAYYYDAVSANVWGNSK
ncbi:DUF4917 family protein [Candidatus Berkiella cookevillensis]|uniref:DUF4917 family protein n=1 Tax=Candidatus Berkiella cookevillensis TaxID=437022 RepID=A0A0Q9YPX5_9GAMM|nr:DUF4917 family protein [Candidatus Berkiella cookevillensis]MCS5707941.1 DUF4917 family protein [Candidatus Berkiella cookevillensis]